MFCDTPQLAAGSFIKRFPQALATIRGKKKMMGYEKGYAYFQEFIPDNNFDTRVTVIGDRAFAFTRNVRPCDFRASGSGDVAYDTNRINHKCLEIAFDVTRKAGTQSLAFDFVLGEKQQPFILEASYCYIAQLVHSCSGYWDGRLKWHEGHVWPQDAILIDLLNNVSASERYSVRPEIMPPVISSP